MRPMQKPRSTRPHVGAHEYPSGSRYRVNFENIDEREFTERTIQSMYRLIRSARLDPELQEIASTIVRDCPHKDYACFGEKILQWTKENIVYLPDPLEIERIQDPYVTIDRGAGDCDDTSILIAALGAAIGFDYRLVTIKAHIDPGSGRKSDQWSHVYTILSPPTGGWYGVDAVVQQSHFGWEPEGYEKKIWDERQKKNPLDAIFGALGDFKEGKMNRYQTPDDNFDLDSFPSSFGTGHSQYKPNTDEKLFYDYGTFPNGEVVRAEGQTQSLQRLVSTSHQAAEMPYSVNPAPNRLPIKRWDPDPFELVDVDEIDYGGDLNGQMFTRVLPSGVPTEADMENFARDVLPQYSVTPPNNLTEKGVPPAQTFANQPSKGIIMQRTNLSGLGGILDDLVNTVSGVLGTEGIINDKTIDQAAQIAADAYLAKQQQEMAEKNLETQLKTLEAQQAMLEQERLRQELAQTQSAGASVPVYRQGWFLPAMVVLGLGTGYFILKKK